jgi:hypothetical protein
MSAMLNSQQDPMRRRCRRAIPHWRCPLAGVARRRLAHLARRPRASLGILVMRPLQVLACLFQERRRSRTGFVETRFVRHRRLRRLAARPAARPGQHALRLLPLTLPQVTRMRLPDPRPRPPPMRPVTMGSKRRMHLFLRRIARLNLCHCQKHPARHRAGRRR